MHITSPQTPFFALCAIVAHILHTSAAGDGFSETPSNVSVHIGGEVILRCASIHNPSNPPLITQWRINSGALLGTRDAGPIPGYDGRYSYVRDGQDELHLKIERVSMENDGRYECQMVRRDGGQFRAAAFVNVVVAPETIVLPNYRPDSVIEVNEGTPLNVTCSVTSAKPPAEVRWYLNGRLVTDEVSAPSVTKNSNHTENTFSSVKLKPSKNDHNKILTCEGVHPQSSTEKRAKVTLNVLYSSERPKIDFIGGKDGIKAGHNVTMVCSAEGGNPPPRLYWLLEDREINSTYHYDFETQTTRSIYSFVAEGSDNGAVYECASVNRENVPPLKKSATLEVEYAPSNVYLYGSTTVRRGETVVVSCASSPSNPPSTISWLKNGATTMPQPQVERRQSHGTVTESNFTVDSNTFPSGQHQISVECVATNNEGSASQQHIIRVLSPPSHPVIYGFEQGAMLEGELLNLTCEAHGGNPLATLSWYRGVEKLKDTRSTVSGDIAQSTVSVLLDRSMNAQQIRCEAENGALDQPLVAAHTLSVLFPPRRILVRQLETDRRQMIAGETTRLSCIVPSANPVPEITWEFESGNANQPAVKHGEYLYNRTVREYGGYEVENVVTFTPTEGMDGTLARCIASHPMWNEAKSQTYRLNVFYAPRIVMDEPVTITVTEGESFRENVTIFANPPVSSHRWRKNGVAFDSLIGTIFVQGPAISGKAVTPQDSGFYTLVVANRFGSANVSIRLIVEYSARITYVTSPVTAGAGEDVVLECEADGVPRKQGMVKWMRGNSVLKSVQDDKRAVLRLNASHDTSGAYTCIADNGVGQPNYTTAYLLVKRAPVLLRNPGYDRAAGPVGGRARVRCRAVAVPTAEFSWTLESGRGARGDDILYNTSKYQFHQVQLDHSTFESTLYIVGLEERDYSRRVRCRVHNRLGDDHAYIAIGPPTAPDIPSQVEALSVKNTSAMLRWQPGFDGGSDQLFEIQYGSSSGVKSLNSSSSQITLTGLKPAELYRVQIRSINQQGRASTFSTPTEFVTMTKDGTAPYSMASTDDVPLPTIIAASAALIALVFLNCLLLMCYLIRKRNKKQLKEKTENLRTMKVADGGYQPVAGGTVNIYGYGSMGTPGMSHRAPSAATNRSDLYNESEDDSAKTVIFQDRNQMDMYGQPMEYGYIPASTDMVVFDEVYAPIHKRSPVPQHHGSTYTPIPYPEPPISMSHNSSPPSLRYAERGGTLGRRDVRASSPASSSYAALQGGSIASYDSGGRYMHMSPAARRNNNNTFHAAPPMYAKQNAYAVAAPIGGSYRTSTDPSLPEGESL